MRLLRCLRYSLALKKVNLVYPVQHRSDLLHIPYPIAKPHTFISTVMSCD